MRTEDGTHHSSLEINGVELSDTGEYTCNVSNPVGFVFRHDRLEVQGVDNMNLLYYSIPSPFPPLSIYRDWRGRQSINCYCCSFHSLHICPSVSASGCGHWLC